MAVCIAWFSYLSEGSFKLYSVLIIGLKNLGNKKKRTPQNIHYLCIPSNINGIKAIIKNTIIF